VSPLIYFAASRFILGAPAELEVMAVHAGQLEDGLMLLDELDRQWGSDGELGAIADLPSSRGGLDAAFEVSWDTVLLLVVSRPPGVQIELVSHQARRIGPVELPAMDVRRALAVELVIRELTDAGCAAAAVAIGDMVGVTEGLVATPFRLAHGISG
jgi:hypothetical protein